MQRVFGFLFVYEICILLAIAERIVRKCPSKESAFLKNSQEWKCDKEYEMYHCLKTTRNRFIEFCDKPRLYFTKGYCIVFNETSREATTVIDHNANDCPFWMVTYEIYKCTICLNYTQTHTIKTSEDPTTQSNGPTVTDSLRIVSERHTRASYRKSDICPSNAAETPTFSGIKYPTTQTKPPVRRTRPTDDTLSTTQTDVYHGIKNYTSVIENSSTSFRFDTITHTVTQCAESFLLKNKYTLIITGVGTVSFIVFVTGVIVVSCMYKKMRNYRKRMLKLTYQQLVPLQNLHYYEITSLERTVPKSSIGH